MRDYTLNNFRQNGKKNRKSGNEIVIYQQNIKNPSFEDCSALRDTFDTKSDLNVAHIK